MLFNRKKCVIPNIKGSIFSNLITSRKLSPGSFVNQNQLVNEECDAGYFKVDSVRYMRCTQNGQWETNTSGKLCLSKYCFSFILSSIKMDNINLLIIVLRLNYNNSK